MFFINLTANLGVPLTEAVAAYRIVQLAVLDPREWDQAILLNAAVKIVLGNRSLLSPYIP